MRLGARSGKWTPVPFVVDATGRASFLPRTKSSIRTQREGDKMKLLNKKRKTHFNQLYDVDFSYSSASSSSSSSSL
jgi:hypothetical protein